MAFACDIFALSPEDRQRHKVLLQTFRPAAHDVLELPDGYRFKLSTEAIRFVDAAEWIDLERRCCPFLRFQLSIAGDENTITLAITGPPGVKPFIETELR